MITIQRKLVGKIRQSVIDEAKGPQNIKPGKWYPILGYNARMAKRKGEEKEHEEVTEVFIINEKGYISWVYASQMEYVVDWEGSKPDGEAKA